MVTMPSANVEVTPTYTTTSAKTDDEGRELLRLFGMPFATS